MDTTLICSFIIYCHVIRNLNTDEAVERIFFIFIFYSKYNYIFVCHVLTSSNRSFEYIMIYIPKNFSNVPKKSLYYVYCIERI